MENANYCKPDYLQSSHFSCTFASMNEMMTIFTQRELFLFIIGSVTYIALFVVTVQNSRRKILSLQERLNKVRAMQETYNVESNRQKIQELELLIQKLGDENYTLRLELEEKKARLDYTNTIARIENEKRERAETDIFSSDIYLKINKLLQDGKSMSDEDWQQLSVLVDGLYTGFTEKLYSLYRLSAQDYHVCLLTKVRMAPKDIALLTAHSKESVATTRSRLYQQIFGKKGSTKDFIVILF